MATVNIHEAKTQFSKLVDAAMRGEETLIAKAGKPAAKLVSILARRSALPSIAFSIAARRPGSGASSLTRTSRYG